MRSVRELTKAQLFIEKYGNTPVGSMDKKRATEVLRRCGVLTKSGKISARYASIIVKIDDTNKRTLRNGVKGDGDTNE